MAEWYEKMPEEWKKRYPIAANGGDIARDYRNIYNRQFRDAVLIVLLVFAVTGAVLWVVTL